MDDLVIDKISRYLTPTYFYYLKYTFYYSKTANYGMFSRKHLQKGFICLNKLNAHLKLFIFKYSPKEPFVAYIGDREYVQYDFTIPNTGKHETALTVLTIGIERHECHDYDTNNINDDLSFFDHN